VVSVTDPYGSILGFLDRSKMQHCSKMFKSLHFLKDLIKCNYMLRPTWPSLRVNVLILGTPPCSLALTWSPVHALVCSSVTGRCSCAGCVCVCVTVTAVTVHGFKQSLQQFGTSVKTYTYCVRVARIFSPHEINTFYYYETEQE
jgi:hypothetical protein